VIAAVATAALLAQGLGQIELPTSGSAAAQQRFLKGVLLLHSFEYDDAREEFQAAQKVDPAFAMAYWGEAMTYNEPLWFFQDTVGGRAALKRADGIAPPTQRERDYLAAARILFGEGDKRARDIEYAQAMWRMHESYPQDLEAASFYALALLGTSHGGRDERIYMRAAAVAEEVFAKNPRHPGALHYLIHCYDDPVHAPLGLRAARVYAEVAPEAAHALHMPSHIFVALGMWDEYVKSNEDSFAASEARMHGKALAIEHRGYHALWWLEYGYLQQGRLREARKLLEIVAADAAKSSAPIVQSHLAQMRAHYTIETGESAPVPRASGSQLDPAAAACDAFAQALLAIRRGDRANAEKLLDVLRTRRPGHAPATHREAHHPPDVEAIAIMEKQIEGLLLLNAGKRQESVEALKQAAEREDRMPFEFGPPMPPKPAHELLGEVLLALGYAPQAQAQFQLALQRAPKRASSLLGFGRAAAKAGDTATSREAYAELRRIRRRAD
jgi:tetratricopeptide (TPR) repeat protein